MQLPSVSMPSPIPPPWLEEVEGDEVPALIESNDTIIRVEAGPGTGKTYGLKKRILRIMHPDGLNIPGDKVLIVAFNRVIAKQLQTVIGDLIQKHKGIKGMPVIRTIHALCLEVMGEEIRLLLPHEREAMIYDCLHEFPKLKEEFGDRRSAEQALRNHEAKHQVHTFLRRAVDKWLHRHKARLIGDVPDLILSRVRLDGGLKEQYSHIVVDEFQDLTPGEQELFARLRIPGASFLALGDPRQSIYAFRGNDRDGLNKLPSLLDVSTEEITDLTIKMCRRCPGDVVDAANELMVLYNVSPMEGNKSRKANTHVVNWKTPQAECKGMAKAIVKNMKDFPPGKDMRHLVMVTRKQFGYLLRDEIRQIDPSYNVDLSFSEGLLDTWAVREAFLFFCLLTDPDAATWRAWLGYKNADKDGDFKANKRNAEAYLNALSASKDAINENVVRTMTLKPCPIRGDGSQTMVARSKRYFNLKENFGGIGTDPTDFIHKILNISAWSDSSFPTYNTATNDMELICSRAEDLLDEVQSAEDAPTSPVEQLRKVAQQLRYAIAVREPFAEGENVHLQVTTFWSSKGLTANHVYVIGLTAETIPGKMREEYPGTEAEYEDEQRRLFYVSITRSKNTLVLSRPLKIQQKDAFKLGIETSVGVGYTANLQISPFLHDIIDYLPDGVKGENWTGCNATT